MSAEEVEEVEIDTTRGFLLARAVYAIDPQAAFEAFADRGGKAIETMADTRKDKSERRKAEYERRKAE